MNKLFKIFLRFLKDSSELTTKESSKQLMWDGQKNEVRNKPCEYQPPCKFYNPN